MDWFSQSNFWRLFYDWMFPAESYDQAKEQIEDIINLSGISKGAVLDLSCGPGRHSIPFALCGFSVTAVDLQAFLLDKAKALATRKNAVIEFVEEDMRLFRRTNSFDLIINMWSSFGYFENPEEDIQVLKNTYDSLRTGGRLVLDVRGKEIHAMKNEENYAHKMSNGDLILHHTTVNDGWTSTSSTWVYVQGEHAHTFQINYNLYSGAELRGLLKTAGFSEVQIYGDLKGAPYNQKATRLVAVAEKN